MMKTFNQKKKALEKVLRLTIEDEEHLDYELKRLKDDGHEEYQIYLNNLNR
jgi:hypothetical protein